MSAWREKLTAHRRRRHVALVRVKDPGALRNEIVRRAGSQRLDSQPRVSRTLRGKNAAVANEEIGDIMRAPKTVYHACGGIPAHPRRADQMSVTRFLHDHCGSGRAHDLFNLCLAEFN